MVYLADNMDQDKPIGLNEIAEKQGLSMRYLEQLVVPLKNASLIKSVVGKHGGYVLGRPAQDIKVGEVVEAAIGPIRLLDCLDPDTDCPFKEVCGSRRMWGLINTRITDVLYDYRLADLSEKRMRQMIQDKAQDRKEEPASC